MRISFLLHHAYDVGGTIRTTFNLGAALAEQHEVEIVSVLRRRERPVFPPGPGVRLRYLVDGRRNSPTYEGEDPAYTRPARHFPRADGKYPAYSALTDRRIDTWLRETDADVLVGTRPGLNTQLALRAPRGAAGRPLLVGQEHVPLRVHTRGLRLTVRDVYPRLDALTTVTEADALHYLARMPLPGVRVAAIPNPVPAPAAAPGDGTGKWIVAAGRLVAVKRYDLLLRAFARVAEQRPDWGLRIYGRGTLRDDLQTQIDTLGLTGRAHLMGLVHSLDEEWTRGSVAACTSQVEAFGMTLVEAMRCGLPVVSTRCPHGPAEIVRHGEDGLLVPVDDAEAFAGALLHLVENDALRQRMGGAALRNAARFDPSRVAERYDALFRDLARRRRGAAPPLTEALHRGRGAAFRRGYAGWDTLRRTARSRAGSSVTR